VSTNEPLNTIPIQQFLNAVKSAEASRSKELKIDITTAKNLAFTLGIVMSRLHGDLEKLVINSKEEEVIKLDLDGGNNF
jgi:hypothetical protein